MNKDKITKRQKMEHILGIYKDNYIGTTKNGVILSFARQNIKDIEEIEQTKTKNLIDEWKGLTFLNYVIEQISLNDFQRIELIEIELSSRLTKNEIEMLKKELNKDIDNKDKIQEDFYNQQYEVEQ